MHATIETAELPFVERQSSGPTARGRREPVQDWFLALRHAQVPFHSNDRLLLLYGDPLVFRLGLYAATERALEGEPVVYLDGANTFDPLVIEGLARAHRRQPRTLLSMIHVARAYTCHQMERLVSDCLGAALERYHAMLAAVRDGVATLKASGRSLADVQAARPSAAFDAAWGNGFMKPDDFVGLVYGTL